MRYRIMGLAFSGFLLSTLGATVVHASTSEIRNNKKSMASGETTVFAQGEGQSASNQSWRGGLGVNFPAGSSVRLLVAQRPVMEKIKPGEVAVTTTASTLTSGYHVAPIGTDASVNTISIVPGACTFTTMGPYVTAKAKFTLDTSSVDVQNLPAPYLAQARWEQPPAINGAGYTAVTSESDEKECSQSNNTTVTCLIQARIFFNNALNPKEIAADSRSCTCTASGCAWN